MTNSHFPYYPQPLQVNSSSKESNFDETFSNEKNVKAQTVNWDDIPQDPYQNTAQNSQSNFNSSRNSFNMEGLMKLLGGGLNNENLLSTLFASGMFGSSSQNPMMSEVMNMMTKKNTPSSSQSTKINSPVTFEEE